MKPAISVIMAVRNEATFVRQAIASILSQSFRDFELIIIDDDSTDGTAEILASFQDSRLIVNRSAQPRGLAASLNIGLAQSKGQYIARMDADDLCEPTRLEEQIAYMERSPQLGLVGSWYVIIAEDGRPLVRKRLPTGTCLQHSLLEGNPFCHGSVMFRRDVVERVGSYRTEFLYAQDYDLWLRISEHYGVDNIPKFLYSWRLRHGNVATSKRWLQKRYRNLAQLCALQRQRGLPEPLQQSDELRSASLTLSEYLAEWIWTPIWQVCIRHGIDLDALMGGTWRV